ncbi:phage portal protein [Luteipulveratus sp. YIM 133132]|uniref:phage portal protein n=1 Tax=Luteipulveratus flavus TaxID=3031728 RepID=UPI0023B1411D|nr:phage portal protein [Luteipulveratus sp. YIM 133132]MDE9365473.1 phage portal protein [Luteipulveratus sp. YIM 133132]
MGFLDMMRPAPAEPVALFADPDPVAVAQPAAADLPSLHRAEAVALDVALSLGAVRKAQHVIAGTIGTLGLGVWQADRRLPAEDPRAAWLAQPDPTRTLQWLLTRTVQDLIWHDRCVWRIKDRTLLGTPTAVERVHPSRIDTLAHPTDPDIVTAWIIDGQQTSADKLLIFDGGGIGGLRRYGADLLGIYAKMQAAVGRYAEAPHPHAILKNHGADLSDEEIDALLASWEKARATRSVGYLNDVVDYETHGYNARDLQLNESREQAALDVARIFGLPAEALDAKSGDSMTYANVVDRRRDRLDALSPWTTVLEQTLSMDDRRGRARGLIVPHGYSVRLDTDSYLRESPKDRATTWKAFIDAGLMTPDEARRLDPLTRSL